MVTRRGLFWLLVPICIIGGGVIRAKERVMASPAILRRWRGSYVRYEWTDGTEVWYSAWDIPEDAKNVRADHVWPESWAFIGDQLVKS